MTTTPQTEKPCIHVGLLPGVDVDLYRWVEIGAEEEGIPCRKISGESGSLLTLAYEAASSSRFQIGVGIAEHAVALHEYHMPIERPVLMFEFDGNAPRLCRLMGSNAARLVVRRPLQVDVDPEPAANVAPSVAAHEQFTPEPAIDSAQAVKLVAIILRKLQERGIA